MNAIRLHDKVLYIEDAFPDVAEFLSALEEQDSRGDLEGIIPQWSKWAEDGDREWIPVKTEREAAQQALLRGNTRITKLVDWDITINEDNTHWPRVEVDSNYSHSHESAYKILEMIDKPYKKALDIWADTFDRPKPSYISKNYCIRKYKTGADMVAHIDRNLANPEATMDWTALIYLNDNYEGGDLVFPDYDIKIKTKAGSIIFFPTDVMHSVEKITEGNKTYLFMFIHSNNDISTALGEPYVGMTRKQ